MSRELSTFYDCTINGQCQPSPTGHYPSLTECQQQCQGTNNADLLYLLLAYDWSLAATFPLSDQQELLRREFKIAATLTETADLIRLLQEGNIYQALSYSSHPRFIHLLRDSPTFMQYLEDTLTDLDYFLVEILEILQPNGYVQWRQVKGELRQWLLVNIAILKREGEEWTDDFASDFEDKIYRIVKIRGFFYGNDIQKKLTDLFIGRLPWLLEEFGG